MNSPKVSVCVPTYNYGRFLAEAVESVIAQTFRDFELLVVDDCSRDNTDEVMRKYAVLDARIRYIRNPRNLGMVENWNYCLQEARGEYIKFLFGDDFLAPDCLDKMVSILDNDASISLVSSARKIVDGQSNFKERWSFFENDSVKNGLEIIKQCLFDSRNYIGEPTAVMFRNKQAGRGFNVKYRQLVDLEMWFHLLEYGNYAYIAEPLCVFRIHDNQQTVVNSRNNVGEREQIYLCRDYLRKPYLGISLFEGWFLIYNYYYDIVWKSYWKHRTADKAVTMQKIAVYGTVKFFAFIPLYKIYKPLRKLAMLTRKTTDKPALPQGSADTWNR